jgi:hypothetical protein
MASRRFAGLARPALPDANEAVRLEVVGVEATLHRDNAAARQLEDDGQLLSCSTGSRVDRFDVRLLLEAAPPPPTRKPSKRRKEAEEEPGVDPAELQTERYGDYTAALERDRLAGARRGQRGRVLPGRGAYVGTEPLSRRLSESLLPAVLRLCPLTGAAARRLRLIVAGSTYPSAVWPPCLECMPDLVLYRVCSSARQHPVHFPTVHFPTRDPYPLTLRRGRCVPTHCGSSSWVCPELNCRASSGPGHGAGRCRARAPWRALCCEHQRDQRQQQQQQ